MRAIAMGSTFTSAGGAFAAAHAEKSTPVRRFEVKSFELDEMSIADLQAGMRSGKYTSVALVNKYLTRIGQIDKRGPAVNAVIEINPDALAIARSLDEER
ncbi:MAG TPA: amidase, partial [Candidatus Angelobacter sp.]|nr:amidase [Candidatus Angelobacter sp.]